MKKVNIIFINDKEITINVDEFATKDGFIILQENKKDCYIPVSKIQMMYVEEIHNTKKSGVN